MQHPNLTFLHGFMGHPCDWDDVRASLDDLETGAIEIQPASDWQTAIQQLHQSIATPSVLVGYSMGARLAMAVAIETQYQATALILISGNPGLESEKDREQRWLADQNIARRIESEPIDSFLEHWYQQCVFASTPQDIRQAEINRKSQRSTSNWPAIMRCHSVSRQPDFWHRLGELSIPTLVIAGERDQKYRNIANRVQKAGHQNITVKLIPDCGHIVHREQPASLVRIIRDFVNQIPDYS